MNTYYVVRTLNGNLILKSELKAKWYEIEYEIYADTLEEAKKQFKEYKKELKKDGLL